MNPSRHDVVVIGAGFAGLSAATALAARRYRVLVLEASSRLGGRATAFEDHATGELVDNGQHVLFGCYRETLAFLRRVGAESNVWLQRDLEVSIIDNSGRRSALACPPAPAPLHLLAGVLEWDALSIRDRLSVLKLVRPLRVARRRHLGRTRDLAASPGETVDEWLAVHGQTERVHRLLWEPLALAALNQPPAVAAAEPFVRVLAELFGGERTDAAIGLPTKPLHEMYAEPARAFLVAEGSEVRTGVRARVALETRSTVRVEAAGESLVPRAVIAAVPWHALSSLADDAMAATRPFDRTLAAADELQASPIVTVNLWLDRPLLDVPFVGLPGRAMQWIFDKRNAFGDRAAHLSLVSSGAAAIVEQPNDRLVDEAMRTVRESLPAARQARLIRATVIRVPKATFSLVPGGPRRPRTRTPFDNFFLAGDWIDTGLPGTIESAVVSGHWAADQAAHLLADQAGPGYLP